MQLKVGWQSPSNIAIVKYWGKYGRQYPRNTSLSFTLQNAVTKTILSLEKKKNSSEDISLRFFFEGTENEKFGLKTKSFLNSISDELNFLKEYKVTVESSNTFPHSSGIASSASGMSAIALCILDAASIIKDGKLAELDKMFFEKASFYSRLGSGSACRSVFPIMSMWGKHDHFDNSSQDFGIAWQDVHEVFHTFHDDILIVSKKEKSVSSTAGHGLMENNTYANARYLQAQQRITELTNILHEGDVHGLGTLAEDEAMTLHALMMCSKPSYVLMEPHTLEIINRIRKFRMDTGLAVYFTLDAGPNIHLLYPDSIADVVSTFIKSELITFCENSTVIPDCVGKGPERLLLV